MMPFATFEMLFCSAIPTAKMTALHAVKMPEISTPICESNNKIKAKYKTNFKIVMTNCCAIFSIFVLLKSFLTSLSTILITIMPTTKITKNHNMFQALLLKKFTILFQIACQSIVSSFEFFYILYKTFSAVNVI